MKNDIINLITTEETQDQDGFPVSVEQKHEVFAEIKSVKGAEFYQASSAGYKVVFIASVNYIDYQGCGIKPVLVEYDDQRYKIVRTYRIKKNNDIELSLQEIE